MIVQLNRYIYMKKDPKNLQYISSKKYPVQNEMYLNKKIHLRYRNENDGNESRRLKNKYNDESIILEDWDNKWWKILRCDAEAPYVAILIDFNNSIIVADSREIINIKFPPNYILHADEAPSKYYSTMDSFYNEYNDEKKYICHLSDEKYVGRLVFTEYAGDLLEYDPSFNILNSRYIGPTNDQIIEKIVYGYPELALLKTETLTSYRWYHNIHLEDDLDHPKRCLNTGYVIAANEYYTVIYEKAEDDTDRFILGEEGFFYYDTDINSIDIKDFNLYG